MKNRQMKLREGAIEIICVAKYREFNATRSYIEREGISNGTMRMKTINGLGGHSYDQVFAGGITNTQRTPPREESVAPEHSENREFNPDVVWSLGTNTKDIEKKLRATKKKLGYIEVEGHRHGGKRKGAGRPNGRKPIFTKKEELEECKARDRHLRHTREEN